MQFITAVHEGPDMVNTLDEVECHVYFLVQQPIINKSLDWYTQNSVLPSQSEYRPHLADCVSTCIEKTEFPGIKTKLKSNLKHCKMLHLLTELSN